MHTKKHTRKKLIFVGRKSQTRDVFCLKAYYKEMKMQENIPDSLRFKGQDQNLSINYKEDQVFS